MTVKTNRPQRTSLTNRSVLGVKGKEPDFDYRIVNDVGDRIESFKERGYEIVTDNSVQVGDKRVANPSKEGTPQQVSVGGGVKAYVMRIKKDWYKEDQQSKELQLQEQEKSMKKEASKDLAYGQIKLS